MSFLTVNLLVDFDMNILVTVGTTAFDELISFVDEELGGLNTLNIVAQISSSAKYTPRNITYFDFSDNFDSYVESADMIITHAGAGSVYSFLERRKRLVVVPNMTRADSHQLELAQYVYNKNFAMSCFDLSDLNRCVFNASEMFFDEYKCERFFAYEQIRKLII